MNRRAALAALAVPALLAFGPAAAARQGAGLQIEAVDARGFPKIEVLVTPPASLYGAVPDAVVLRENGEARQVTVSLLSAEPLEVLLLVDTSGSMRGAPLEAAKAAAAGFLAALPPTTRTSVMGFAAVPGEAGDFSEDPAEAGADLARLQAGGETALYDAVAAALDAVEAAGRGRPFVVLLTDGGDTASTRGLAETLDRLQASSVRFYAVELQTEESDPAPLQALADVGAGQVVSAADPQGLAAMYDLIAASLVNQLVIGYTSASGGPVELAISVSHQGVNASASATVTLPGPGAPTSSTTTSSTTTRPPAGDPEPAPTVPAAPPPASFVAPSPGPLGAGWVLPTGLAAAFLAVLTTILLALAPGDRRGLPVAGGARERFTPAGGLLTRVTNRAKGAAEKALTRRGHRSTLSGALDAAGIRLAAGEFLILTLSAIVAAASVGVLLFRLPGALTLGALALIVPRMLVGRARSKRREAFAAQLDGTLQLLAGSLRAGYGLLQAVSNIAAEAAAPTGQEFGRIMVETRLGRDLVESLTALAQRMDSPDFRWVTQAIEIQRSVGGDLSQILDTVGQTIRERNQIRRQIKALSAEGRISSYILIAIPFFLAAFILVMAPEFIAPLWTTTSGLVAIAVGVVLMLVGIAWIRRLVRLRF
jgi:tight adherence protein B